MDRRRLLEVMAAGAAAALAALVGAPVASHLVTASRRRATAGGQWHPLGRVDEYPLGTPSRVAFPVTVRDGWTEAVAEQAAWVVRGAEGVTVLSGTCPHLGCSVRFLAKTSAFACPCHESEFSAGGEHRAGPARRGLDPLPSRVVDGRLEVRWVEYQAGTAERREL